MEAHEGEYDEKYSWLKSMGGFDDILRFADYIPDVPSHTPLFPSLTPQYSLLRRRKPIMAQYTHQKHSCKVFAFGIMKIDLLTSPNNHARLSILQFSLFVIFCCPRIRWQGYFLLLCRRCFPSFHFNMLDERRRAISLYPHYLCTDTQSVRMLYFIGTLVSHVLSSSEI